MNNNSKNNSKSWAEILNGYGAINEFEMKLYRAISHYDIERKLFSGMTTMDIVILYNVASDFVNGKQKQKTN